MPSFKGEEIHRKAAEGIHLQADAGATQPGFRLPPYWMQRSWFVLMTSGYANSVQKIFKEMKRMKYKHFYPILSLLAAMSLLLAAGAHS